MYFVGAFDRRITFFSQQVRALKLAHALTKLNILKPTETIAVVGGGAAGATAAVALALAGNQIFLFDPAAKILQLQSASTRLLHPHIYEWPHLGSLSNEAGLPVLDWEADSAGKVCARLIAEFEMAAVRLRNLEFMAGRTLKHVERGNEEWLLTFDEETPRAFKHVILAMGFGQERTCGDAIPVDYWKPTNVGTPATDPRTGTTYLVSGSGDGALTEVLALLVTDFEHVTFTQEFLGWVPDGRLNVAARAVFNRKEGEALEPFLKAEVLPVLKKYGVLDILGRRLREDRKITVNSRNSLFAAGKAAQLNQVMAYAVLEAAEYVGRPVTLSTGDVTNVAKLPSGMNVTRAQRSGTVETKFDHVLLRHGPAKEERYQPVSVELTMYEQRVRSLAAGGISDPPFMDTSTYDFFKDLSISKLADHASVEGLRRQASQERSTVSISLDPAATELVERGYRTIEEVAATCDSEAAVIHIAVDPSRLPDAMSLVRLSKASAGRVQIQASAECLVSWQALLGSVVSASSPSTRLRPRLLEATGTSGAIDNCLMRLLNHKIATAVADHGSAPIGAIADDILSQVQGTWGQWKTTLEADTALTAHFLRWLAHVAQDEPQPWDGDHAHIQRMANALLMVLAAHHGQQFAPALMEHGNLRFGNNAVAVGSGCEAIGLESVTTRRYPNDWGVDALILSGCTDMSIDDPGSVANAGDLGIGFMAASRVRPAVIQRSKYWCDQLASGMAAWKIAVRREFNQLRERQDQALRAIS